MWMFEMIREEDVTGVSDVCIVAEGIVFEDGTAVLRSLGTHPTTVIHESLDSVKAIHGHHGKTRVRYYGQL